MFTAVGILFVIGGMGFVWVMELIEKHRGVVLENDPLRRDSFQTAIRAASLRSYKSIQECPKCSNYDYHWIIKVGKKYVTRQCRNCEYDWIQNK